MSKVQLSPAVSHTLSTISLDDDAESSVDASAAAPTASPRASSAPTTRAERVECVRIVLVGDSNVGKTELANCFKTRTFSGTTVASIGVGYTSVDLLLCAERIRTRVELYDTAGQERFGNYLMRNYYRLAKGMIIVFDPQNADSLVRAQKMYAQITDDVPDIVCMFVANKIDLFQGTEEEWAVRLKKLTNLFTPPPSITELRRPPSELFRPEELEMPLKAISLLRTPAVALDLVAELAQRILINAATSAARLAANPLSPRSGAVLGSSKAISRQQRQRVEAAQPKGKPPPGSLRLKRIEEYNKNAKKKPSGFCFF